MSGIKGPCLNLDLHYFSHVKVKRLIGLLGKGSEVLPIKLWCDQGKHRATDGNLHGLSAQEIEAIIEWWGRAGQAVKALHKVGFLDRHADGTFVIHDWTDHEGHLVTFREKARHAANVRWGKERAQKHAPSMPDASLKHAPGNAPSVPAVPTVDPPLVPPRGPHARREDEGRTARPRTFASASVTQEDEPIVVPGITDRPPPPGLKEGDIFREEVSKPVEKP